MTPYASLPGTTKHLKKLDDLRMIHMDQPIHTAKPDRLLGRLIDVFTRDGDTCLELFSEAADLASVAIKKDRRFIFLSGASQRDRSAFDAVVVPRLRAVVDGNDIGLEGASGGIDINADTYLPYEGGGDFLSCRLGPPVLSKSDFQETPAIIRGNYAEPMSLRSAVLTAEGFIPIDDAYFAAQSLADDTRAIWIDPDQFLTQSRLAEIAAIASQQDGRVVVFYFRGSRDLDLSAVAPNLVCRRVPSELQA